MFGSLFIASTLESICEALGGSESDGLVAVIAQPRVGAGLQQRGLRVLQVSDRVRALRRSESPRVCAAAGQLPLADQSVAAVVGFGVSEHEHWAPLIKEWSRVVRDGGMVILVDRGSPTEQTRRALCGGLCEIEQRHAGRTVVASGLVTKLGAAL